MYLIQHYHTIASFCLPFYIFLNNYCDISVHLSMFLSTIIIFLSTIIHFFKIIVYFCTPFYVCPARCKTIPCCRHPCLAYRATPLHAQPLGAPCSLTYTAATLCPSYQHFEGCNRVGLPNGSLHLYQNHGWNMTYRP